MQWCPSFGCMRAYKALCACIQGLYPCMLPGCRRAAASPSSSGRFQSPSRAATSKVPPIKPRGDVLPPINGHMHAATRMQPRKQQG